MSYGPKWKIRFDDCQGRQLCVTIHKKDYVGEASYITGGASPFTTCEDDDEDIFAPVRGQTGYIRIIADSLQLPKDIFPHNNLDTYVSLTSGEDVLWQGFLQSDIYTQPWSSAAYEFEFPVSSILGTLESTRLSDSYQGSKIRIHEVLYAIFRRYGVDLDFYIGTSQTGSARWLYYEIDSSAFFSEEEGDEDGATILQAYGNNGKDILSEIGNLLGVVFREQGKTIYILEYTEQPRRYIHLPDVESLHNPHDIIYDINGRGTDGYIGDNWVINYTQVFAQRDFMRSVEWRGADNTVSLRKGMKSAKVTVTLKEWITSSIQMPEADYAGLPYYERTLGLNGDSTLRVQPVNPANIENPGSMDVLFVTYASNTDVYKRKSEEGCDYSICEANSPWHKHYRLDNLSRYSCGAFPCRWSVAVNGGEGTPIETSESIYISGTGEFLRKVNDSDTDTVVTLHGRKSSAAQGYFAIKYSPYAVIEWWYYYDFVRGTATFPPTSQLSTQILEATGGNTILLYFTLQIGDKQWNGTSWEDKTDTPPTFPIKCENGSISNYDSSWEVENNGGFYIPLPDESGEVILGIQNNIVISSPARTNDGAGDSDYVNIGRGVFLNNFEGAYVYKKDTTQMVSQERSNTYYGKTGSDDFAGSKQKNVSIGTYKDNRPSPSFLYYMSGDYVQTEPYYTSNGFIEYIERERIESHLLSRLRKYYSLPRTIYEGLVRLTGTKDTDIPLLHYIYGGRIYTAIDKSHDWREDTQRLMLIEINDYYYEE